MRRFRSVTDHAGWLLTALGVAAGACGGNTTGDGGSGGTTGGSGGTTGGSGGVAGGTNKFPCKNPQPILVNGQDTGVDMCASGMARRREAKTCPEAMPRVKPCTATQMYCNEDTDCTEAQHGYCAFQYGGGGASNCGCRYGCVDDSECQAGEVCLCGYTVGTCVPADCKTSGDCAEGYDCISPVAACTEQLLHCQSPADECGGTAHCGNFEYCGVGPLGNRVCKSDGCAGVGRPFLVEGAPRLAPAAARDFGAEAPPDLGPLSEAERHQLAEHWTTVGLMEHASVAAFARFALQLLGLGAPIELIESSNAAQVDETRHARIAFAFASAYAGRPIGPGALDLSGALPPLDPRQVLRDVIREGCIGETLAAVEAAHASEHARDPVVRAALADIARDEADHGALAWRFVAWMLRERPELAAFARQELNAAREEVARVPLAARRPDDGRRLELGVVAGRERDELRRDALDRVVAPCAAALFDGRAVFAPPGMSPMATFSSRG